MGAPASSGQRAGDWTASWGLEKQEGDDALIVLGSGNLGLVYVPEPERLTLAEIDRRWPQLVPGLAAHPGIGFVAGLGVDGPVAIGPSGRHHLATGVVEGTDPLEGLGAHAPAMLMAAASMARAPDLYVNSAVDPTTLDVAAFEPLVGCHGGLGGWQDRGFVMAAARPPGARGAHHGRRRPASTPDRDPAVPGPPHRTGEEHRMTSSRASRLLITAAAAVIVIAGLKAASDIVGPLMLAVSLTIVFHPLRIRLERRLPSWAASIVVLVCAYVLILVLIVSLIVAIGRLAVLVPSYAPELNGYVQDVGDWLANAGVGSDQVAAATDAADAGRLVGLATDVLSSTVAILSDLFFLVALLLFLAFDSAKVSELAAGAREEHAGFVDAMTSFAHGTRSYLGGHGDLRPDRRRGRHRSALGDGGAGGVRLGCAGVRHQLHPQHRLRHRAGAPGVDRAARRWSRA